MKTSWRIPQRGLLLGTATTFAVVLGLSSVQAGVMAYWNFEEGTAGANVARGGLADGQFYGAVYDNSGNGYALSAWSDGGFAGYQYRADTAAPKIPLNSGAPNNLSVKNTGGYPAMFTQSGTALQTWTPTAWTIEVAFKPENGGYRTFVGRDSQGANTEGANPNPDLSALYLQAIPGDALAIKYCDVAGYWHEAISADGLVHGFDYSTDPDGVTGQWQDAVAVSDGSTLSLYYRNLSLNGGWSLVASADLTASGSPNTALTSGTGSGSDWDAGNFSVGRGLYAGGHTDRAYGYIDDVRLSDAALTPSQFLYVPEPSTLGLAAMGLAFAFALIRRRSRA